jgi:hypothetical protein
MGLGWPVGIGLLVALLGGLTLIRAETAGSQEPVCTGGEDKTIVTGIVKVSGCWVEARDPSSGAMVWQAPWAINNEHGVDLNGFILKSPQQPKGALQVNPATREVSTVGPYAVGHAKNEVQLYSHNWPAKGTDTPIGDPIALDFVAPQSSGLLLEDLKFGSNNALVGALAGFSPVGTVETPVRLEPGGTGAIDTTVALAGVFTLKDRPQSVTVELTTEPEEGTKLDGFEIKLQEIDAIRFFTLYDLEAQYSAEKSVLGGSVNIGFPFFEKKGSGVGASFKVEDQTLTDVGVSVHGLHIPIDGGGFLTDLAGTFHIASGRGEGPIDFVGYCRSISFTSASPSGGLQGDQAAYKWRCTGPTGPAKDYINLDKACKWKYPNKALARALVKNPNDATSVSCANVTGGTDFQITANAGADIGPELPTPFGEIAPIRVDAALAAGSDEVHGFFVDFKGGVAVFRIPVGNVSLTIYGSGGVSFGVGLGLGVPSFRDNPNDSFYIGAHVDGWVGKGHYQFRGDGRIRLFGADILAGEILVNDRVLGSCWKVLNVPGGVYYRYGEGRVHDFGLTCGLNDYIEQFPAAARAQAATGASGRTFRLARNEKVLAVRGVGGAPRFTLRSGGGQVVRTPTGTPSAIGRNHAVFINEGTSTTHVVLPHPQGTWTITADPGSARIASVKAARSVPKTRVRARVVGSGTRRTLVWSSNDEPNTRLLFTEIDSTGAEFPILNTGKARGRKSFNAGTGSGYGKRRIRVTVLEGGLSRQGPKVVDHYSVHRPARLAPPVRLSAARRDHAVFVKWSGARNAHGYLVVVSMRSRKGKLLASYVRRVSARKRAMSIHRFPGGGRAVAKVFTLNIDGRPGSPRRAVFRTGPSVGTLGAAAKRSAKSAVAKGNAVLLRMQCPINGHCRERVTLRTGGRVVGHASYQQTPDTFHLLRIKNRALTRALGRGGSLRAVVKMRRLGHDVVAKAAVES